MVGVIVGTSGYSYADWVGTVYPEGTRPVDYLAHYARRFALTELNFSYYREPTTSSLRQIALKSPPGFAFTIKAHKSLTHERGAEWIDHATRFRSALEGLTSVRRNDSDDVEDTLAGVLLQFPFSFHYTAENRRYLASLSDAFDGVRTFVEFRNDEWDEPSVWREMEKRRLGLVIPDLPRLDGLPRTAPRLTTPWGYVRFHGRNAAGWWAGSNVSRYDYLYSEEELCDWIGPVTAMANDAESVIVTFNNPLGGQAVQNAKQFSSLLGLDQRDGLLS